MSGTPVGSVVDDLLGQLIFLGVEPYCSRGDNGDAFWEREVSNRWRARDPDALEVVHDLLGQIMMRHSKAQTMAGSTGQRLALVDLPPKVEDVVLLPLRDASERAVYGELEKMARDDFQAREARYGPLPIGLVHRQPANHRILMSPTVTYRCLPLPTDSNRYLPLLTVPSRRSRPHVPPSLKRRPRVRRAKRSSA